MQADAKPPGVWKTLTGVVAPVKTANSFQARTVAYHLIIIILLCKTFICVLFCACFERLMNPWSHTIVVTYSDYKFSSSKLPILMDWPWSAACS